MNSRKIQNGCDFYYGMGRQSADLTAQLPDKASRQPNAPGGCCCASRHIAALAYIPHKPQPKAHGLQNVQSPHAFWDYYLLLYLIKGNLFLMNQHRPKDRDITLMISRLNITMPLILCADRQGHMNGLPPRPNAICKITVCLIQVTETSELENLRENLLGTLKGYMCLVPEKGFGSNS